MYKISIKYIWLLVTTGIFISNSNACDYRLVNRLSGYWKFSIGDDLKWIDPNYNDENWDQIYVPSDWERNGYEEYNGYAWYRKKFEVFNIPDDSPLFLNIGKIDDIDEVYLNGKLIGNTGVFPSQNITYYTVERIYPIPKELLNQNGPNVIAVRVYDMWGPGGIRSGSIGIYVNADYSLIDISLDGLWQFNLGNRREWRNPDYNASGWEKIHVPSAWENQGFPDYDGYACYRNEFIIPDRLKNERIYLSLGKIDDIDEVYFNGQFIGTVYDLLSRNDFKRNGREYTVQRIYLIPNYLIKYNKKNLLTIVVYDGRGRGGIYEGPVGIMSSRNYERFRNKYNEPSTFWEYLYEWLVD